jgi:hypothetical protein
MSTKTKVEKLERVLKLLDLAYDMLREDDEVLLSKDVLGCIDAVNEEIMDHDYCPAGLDN